MWWHSISYAWSKRKLHTTLAHAHLISVHFIISHVFWTHIVVETWQFAQIKRGVKYFSVLSSIWLNVTLNYNFIYIVTDFEFKFWAWIMCVLVKISITNEAWKSRMIYSWGYRSKIAKWLKMNSNWPLSINF